MVMSSVRNKLLNLASRMWTPPTRPELIYWSDSLRPEVLNALKRTDHYFHHTYRLRTLIGDENGNGLRSVRFNFCIFNNFPVANVIRLG